MRFILLFLVLVVLVLVPFFLWGDFFMNMFTQDGINRWLDSFGDWGWLAAIILLIGDLLLPLPATVIMAGLGYLYGLWWGGIIGSIGSCFAGALGYWLCYLLGDTPAKWILGKDYDQSRLIFSRVGTWLVMLSRWLPVFPEVISCMAGLNKMSAWKFHSALIVGTIPMAFVYAFIGAEGRENPTMALILSAATPPLIWLLVNPFFQKKKKSAGCNKL